MMPFNITEISQLSEGEVLKMCSDVSTVPSTIILFISIFIIFAAVGFPMVKNNKGKLAAIIGLSFILSFAVLVVVAFMPNVVQSIVNFFTGWF